MVFTDINFLFLFLPIVLLLYFLIKKQLRNTLLLASSFLFYFFGEHIYLLVMLAYIVVNYFYANFIENTQNLDYKKLILILSVITNLSILIVFKYINFLVDNLNYFLSILAIKPLHLSPVHLPLGISFITFHAVSYIVDIYHAKAKAQKNPINFALYISLFPQLIAGPIIRYRDISTQLTSRIVTLEGFSYGLKRFVIGMAKKVLIANTVGAVADKIFAIPASQLTTGIAWTGIVCYTLQIYFDFSGYSDMAIGLCKMFGFTILENFNYPYISKSIREFWHRWHISLSNWFRDYLYIPLGGNRCSESRSYFNLVVVFFLCGLWHGASWTFVVWGLYHGIFLVLERTQLGAAIKSWPSFLQHGYTLLAVMIGWVFFRADTFSYAASYIAAMFGLAHGNNIQYHLNMYMSNVLILTILVGIIGSTPIISMAQRLFDAAVLNIKMPARTVFFTNTIVLSQYLVLSLLLISSMMVLAVQTYNPFIYFRF